jgi:hypothetical protein
MILITQEGSRVDDPINMVWGMVKHEAHPISHQNNRKHCGKHRKIIQITHMNVVMHGNMLP